MKDETGGYVKIYRRVLDDPDFANAGEALAFVYLVMKAAWRPCRVRYKGRQIDLGRGELALSVRDFASDMGWSKDRCVRFLKRLTRDKIATQSETGVHVITICNYDIYQSDVGGAATVCATGPRQDRDRTATQNKEEKENKEENKKTKGLDFPDWLPLDEWMEFEKMRVRVKSPMTDHAKKLALAELAKLREAGGDPKEILNASIMNSWKGLFPVRSKTESEKFGEVW